MKKKRRLSELYCVQNNNLIVLSDTIRVEIKTEDSPFGFYDEPCEPMSISFDAYKLEKGEEEMENLRLLWNQEQTALCKLRMYWLFKSHRQILKYSFHSHLYSKHAVDENYRGLTEVILGYTSPQTRQQYIEHLALKHPDISWIRDLIITQRNQA